MTLYFWRSHLPTGFEPMLAGALAVDDYLRPLDVEYPAFSRDMCYLLRELQAEGKKIFQMEPFLEILLGIHEFFAEGHRPGELNKTFEFSIQCIWPSEMRPKPFWITIRLR